MKTWSVWLSAGLMGSTLACAGGSQTGAQTPMAHVSAAKTPEEVAALFAREASAPLHSVPITVLEGTVSGTVEAASTPKITSEENDQGVLVSVVTIPIGTDVPLTCIFRMGRVNAGMAMGHMMAPVSSGEGLGGKPFAPEMSVAVAEGVPILMATSTYVENGAPMLAKVAVAPRDHGTVLCTHFEAGYRATFAKHVASIVGSIKVANAPPAPRWREVRKLEKGSAVAFQERDIWSADKPGQLVARTRFASFLEIEGHWVGLDGISDETYAARGGAVLEKATELDVAGTPAMDFKLTQKRSGEYVYEGKRQNEALHGTFTTRAPITSEASRAQQVRSWLSGRANETRFLSYDEMENAKGPIDVVFKRGADKTTVTVETRGAKVSTVRCTVDANGFCETEDDAEEGSRETRLFVRGSL